MSDSTGKKTEARAEVGVHFLPRYQVATLIVVHRGEAPCGVGGVSWGEGAGGGVVGEGGAWAGAGWRQWEFMA